MLLNELKKIMCNLTPVEVCCDTDPMHPIYKGEFGSTPENLDECEIRNITPYTFYDVDVDDYDTCIIIFIKEM